MARSMNLDVLVRLRDRLSGPLRKLMGVLKGIGQLAGKIGLVGAAVAAISFMGPIKEAAAFQQKLIDIAATTNRSGDVAFAYVDQLRGKYEGLALSVGQLSDTVATGAGKMIADGVSEQLVDASIASIGKAATAANAQFEDMAGVATSMLKTLKLPADELDDALGALVVSGKEGAFELKNMARYFPTLTSQMAKYGVTGREAVNFLGAALQIAMKGTADPAEAANNLKNFVSKIAAPATIKNFKDAGVDIQAVMADAATKGINPIEAVMQKIVKLTGVSGGQIEKMMKAAEKNGLKGGEAMEYVREQLQAIHGAGALGEIFADQQVMDFLIPFLTNVDEYKRIKNEVAKATGSAIDEDFETQMRGLNRQLITFQEIGTQASREVGFAFGTWLPTINEHLMAGLKWFRNWNEETDGLGSRLIAIAGAGVAGAAALGALGIVLPIIGAGFGVLAALISPVGLAIAAVAAAGMYIWRNWSTYGPRLTRMWDQAKQTFWRFADGVKDRGRRIIQSGRDMVAQYGPMVGEKLASAWNKAGSIMQEAANRYGPQIREGLLSAIDDVKAGWENLQSLFEGFKNGFDFKVDLSGLTIDDAKLNAFRNLDGILQNIKAAWNAMKEFGAGFAPWLDEIGESVGGTVSKIFEIGAAFGRIANALGKMAGVDTGKVSGFFRMIGDLVGGSLALALWLLNGLASVLASVANALADVAEKVAAGIDWSGLLPDVVTESWNKLANAINAVKSALSGFSAGSVAKPGEILPNGGAAGSTEDGSDRSKSMDDFLDGPPKIPFKKAAANSNEPVTRFAEAQPRSRVDVGGVIRVAVEGPGKVVGASSDNSSVKIAAADTGRAIGRA